MRKSNRPGKLSSFRTCSPFHASDVIWVTFLLLPLLITGCVARRTELSPTITPVGAEIPFESIDQREWTGRSEKYQSKEIGMVILTGIDEVSAIKDFIHTDSFKTLQSLDFNHYFGLAVFQGYKPTNLYSITIEKVMRNGNIITVQVATVEPSPDMKKGDIITSPYHLIKINKGNDFKGRFTFVLVEKGQQIISMEKQLP